MSPTVSVNLFTPDNEFVMETIDHTNSMNSSYHRESGEEGVSVNESTLSHDTSFFDEIEPVDGVSDDHDSVSNSPSVLSFSDADSDQSSWEETFEKKLGYWAVESNVTRESVNKLLALLKSFPNFSFLPTSYKTLLGTKRVVRTVEIAPGRYYSFDLVDQIISSLKSCGVRFNCPSQTLKMYIGCDGMPSSKSSNNQFWPILGRLKLQGAKPFEIGLYHGHSKPKDANDYLYRFQSDISRVIENGIEYQGTVINIQIEAFCCDAPAMSFIKCIKPCGAYHGCMKCETVGEYILNEKKKGGRVTYPETDARLRTDESFRNQEQRLHHEGTAVLQKIPHLDMVKSFPIDPMHLVFGVVRTLLKIWIKNKRSMKIRVTEREIFEISQILVKIRGLITQEFSRKTRSLDELSRFKTTELRLLLLYVLPVVLKKQIK